MLDTGDDFPWRRAAELRRTSSNPAFWGLNGPVLGSRRFFKPCVIHLCAQDGGLELRTACVAVGRVSAAAPAGVRACALCGARVRVLEGLRPCAEAKTNTGRV